MDSKKKRLSLGDIIRRMSEGTAGTENPPQPSRAVPADSHARPLLRSHTPDVPPAPEGLPHQPSFADIPAVLTGARAAPAGDVPAAAGETAPKPQQAAAAPQAPPPPGAEPLTADHAGGESGEDEEEFDIFRYIGVILRRRMVIGIVTAGLSVFSLFSFLTAQKYYIASARLLFRPDQNVILPDHSYYWYDQTKTFNTHLELLRSNIVLERVAQNLDGRVGAGEIGGGLTIKQGEISNEKTDIIDLSYRHPDAATARDVVNDLCRTYIEYHREVNAQEDTRLIINLKTQIDKLERELDEREDALRRFKEQNRLIQLSSEANIVVTKLTNMEVEMQQTQLGLLTSKEQLGALKSQIHQQDINIVQSMTYENPFQARIAELELELNTLSGEYSPDHFKIRTLKQQIRNLKEAMQSEITKEAVSQTFVKNPIRQNLLEQLVTLSVEVASLEAKRTAQEQLIEKLNEELLKLPSLEQHYAYLQRETDARLQTLSLLKQKYEEAKIERDAKESDIKILELAKLPEVAVSSKKFSSVLMGVLVGLILGVALAFLLEYLDQTLKDVAQVEKALEIPLLGVVPHIDADVQGGAFGENPEKAVKSLLEPFRALRASLKHLAGMHNAKVIMICSAVKGEGKTTLSVNLALTFALDGKRVILVDGDLRRSQIHHFLNVPKEKGLHDYMQGAIELDGIIKETSYTNLCVVTSGERPHNPAELLGTPRFDRLLAEIRRHADIVIFDSPAILPVSDSLIMAPKMDACLLVVRTLWTPIRAVKHAKGQLKRIGSKMLGCIVNGVPHSRGYYPYYYGYYGYYSYKYSYENEPRRPMSIREFGLKVESGVKESLKNLRHAYPRYISAASVFMRHILRRPSFHVLLLLALVMTGVRLYLEHRRPKPRQDDALITYLGAGSAQPDAYQGAIRVTGGGRTTPTAAAAGAGYAHGADTGAITYNESGESPAWNASDQRAVLDGWIAAVNARDSLRFASFYDAAEFRYPAGGFGEWMREIASQWSAETGREHIIRIDSIAAAQQGGAYYRTDTWMSVDRGGDTVAMTRTMIWRFTNGGWKIIREKAQALQ